MNRNVSDVFDMRLMDVAECWRKVFCFTMLEVLDDGFPVSSPSVQRLSQDL